MRMRAQELIKLMARPKNFKVSAATRRKLSAALTGHRVTIATRKKIAASRRSLRATKALRFKIGRGVRHGSRKKVKVGLRFDQGTWGKFKRECRSLKLKYGPLLEDLMQFWMKTTITTANKWKNPRPTCASGNRQIQKNRGVTTARTTEKTGRPFFAVKCYGNGRRAAQKISRTREPITNESNCARRQLKP